MKKKAMTKDKIMSPLSNLLKMGKNPNEKTMLITEHG